MMSNIWTGRKVTLNTGARVRVWSDATRSSSTYDVDEFLADVELRVTSAIACSSMNGGGSNLTLVDPDFPEYKVWCHSSQVEALPNENGAA